MFDERKRVRAAVRIAAAFVLGLLPLAAPQAVSAVSFRVYDAVAGIDLNVPPEAMLHTLRHDVFDEADGTSYVQTGDIPAMWLRDSAAQIKPYVQFVSSMPALSPIVRGVIERNARNVVVDPYANAFSANYRVWERKWEVDSLAYHVLLATEYWHASGDRSLFTPALHRSLQATVATYACERRHERCSSYGHAAFPRREMRPVRETGMIWGAFRPSDDRLRLPYNIPQQMFAAVALRNVAELGSVGYSDAILAREAREMAVTIGSAVETYGRVYDFRHGWMYAFEVDGLGGAVLMDDANLPNLLSAPLLGYVSASDPTYLNTRRYVLSRDNPYFFSGRIAAGVGSSHTKPGWAWPLSLATRVMTAQSREEVAEQLTLLARTATADGLIHESFDVDDSSRYSRGEFGWANAAYAEALLHAGSAASILPRPVAVALGRFEHGANPILVNQVDGWENRAAFIAALATMFEPSTHGHRAI